MPTSRANRKTRSVEEQAFLQGYDPSKFERPSVAVDIVLLTAVDGTLRVVVVRRNEHPARGAWSIPGGFVGIRESLDHAAARVIDEKVGLAKVFVEQLYTFGGVQRDPRTRVISVAYYALVDVSRISAAVAGRAGADLQLATIRVPWKGETGGAVNVVDDKGAPLALAFDHAEILGMAVKRIRGKLDYSPIGFQLLPSRFTLRRLQLVHETILDRALNKDAFRRRMLATGLLRATGTHEEEVGHRPAELYRFTSKSAV